MGSLITTLKRMAMVALWLSAFTIFVGSYFKPIIDALPTWLNNGLTVFSEYLYCARCCINMIIPSPVVDLLLMFAMVFPVARFVPRLIAWINNKVFS